MTLRTPNQSSAVGSLILSTLAAVVLLTGCQRSISGTYLVSDNGSVVWLELVRTPDNHLTGQLSLTTLKPDGTIDRNSVSVAGAIDGEMSHSRKASSLAWGRSLYRAFCKGIPSPSAAG